jgi:hypothetical protein
MRADGATRQSDQGGAEQCERSGLGDYGGLQLG